METPRASSASTPAAPLAQRTVPLLSYLAMKTSSLPMFVKTVEPKAIEGLSNLPIIYTFSSRSMETLNAYSKPAPPALFAQRTFPLLSYFAKKISFKPTLVLVKVVVPKLIEEL